MAFSINTHNIKTTSTELSLLTKAMSNIQLELTGLCLSLKLLGGSAYQDLSHLVTEEKKHVTHYKEDLKNLVTALNEINYAYLKTENNLVSTSQIRLFRKFDDRGENPLCDKDFNDMDTLIQDFESSDRKSVV